MAKRIAPTALTPAELEAFNKRKASGQGLGAAAQSAKVSKGKRGKRIAQTSEGRQTTAHIMENMPTLGPLLKKANKDPLAGKPLSPSKNAKKSSKTVRTHTGQGGRKYVVNGSGNKCYIEKRGQKKSK